MFEENCVAARFRLARFVVGGGSVLLLVPHCIGGETRVDADSMIDRPAWPLRVKVVSEIVPGIDKAYLEDQKGKPFLYNADTCWHLMFQVHVEWDRNQTDAVSKVRPAILGESTYIGHGAGGDWRVRRNMHWPILAGGAGHAHGNDPINPIERFKHD